MTGSSVFDLMLRKFETRAPLDDADRAALRALPHRRQIVEPAAYIVREGQVPDRSCLILSGFAYRHKLTVEGTRQIISVHIPGDFVDLDGALLNISDHHVQALTRCEIACIPRPAIRDLIGTHPRVGGNVGRFPDRRLDLPRMGGQHRPPRCSLQNRAPALRNRSAAGGCRSGRAVWLRVADDTGTDRRRDRPHVCTRQSRPQRPRHRGAHQARSAVCRPSPIESACGR